MSTWKPHVTVAAIVEHSGQFLMVEEHTVDGVRLNQPAGHLEEHESLADACVRETLEETAHHVRVDSLVGIYQWTRPDGAITYLRFVFACRLLGEEQGRALDEGIIRAAWLNPEELRAEPLRLRSPMVMQCLEDYLAGHRFPLDLVRSWV
ncbi:MAG: NUDIX hydrolase [Candidatus Dactylopiibacterium carminicum]|uniref:Phosphatase NudJ n=1 Tax=Candidatus Dactylopiibacterium carminicum TaxID=857335 RepID=A0A272END4_9RHOO|nr:NUDIX hydrolase [Candidatus Dactylopiibacterium carminicum]KAF7598063.1 NUDIX hydrolase [Candidatus Dactylopiibacterium carminicum]PAS91638.1 MAG: NUDIX hydrolase [Candidatus Dactylopiibacterium carminicum]PAS93602.1 MAG: NUDIX hydrolase [Candidatus Dactylopiibacterium carminicum]PAS96505.1 MAG: NUDIX hydrolase [Candidatus Dactylopiibacterium carminicum]